MTHSDCRRSRAFVPRPDDHVPPSEAQERAVSLIREQVTEADRSGVVVNLSGGIDSSTTAAVAVEALGAEKVVGLTIPTSVSATSNMEDARSIANHLGISHETIPLRPVLSLFTETIAPELPGQGDTYALGNVGARLRMAIAYYAANATDRLVAGTSNRTERLLGYFTKYGDGGVDMLPLGDCYKTEVRALARLIGVPKRIIEKPPTAEFWEGQTDESELGAPYGLLDPILRQLVDRGHEVESVAELLECDTALVGRYARQINQTAHKRALPPTRPRQAIIEGGEAETVPAGPPPVFGSTPKSLVTLQDELTGFIQRYVTNADIDGVVVNLSGGIDSSVTAALAVEALGADHVFGLVLPCGKATEATTFDATRLAETLGIEYARVSLHPLFRRLQEALPVHITEHADVRTNGNLISRLRMACAYYVANTLSRLLLGTTTRAEWLLGYFTKYGDGGVDLQPLTGLYKTEIRALARYLEIPDQIVEKPSTAGVYAGQTDEDDLGASYSTLDTILWYLIDANISIENTAANLGVEANLVEQYAKSHLQTQHKRCPPPTPTAPERGHTESHFHELELAFS